MAKRFTDTNKWEDPWYMDLSPEFRSAFEYVLDKCSNIGLWKPNKRLCEFCIGFKVDWDAFAAALGKERLAVLDNGDWWLLKFIDFQHGVLDEDSKSKPIMAYIRELKKHNLWIDYQKGMDTLKGKGKGNGKGRGEGKGKGIELFCQEFEEARKLFPGTKLGYKSEFDNFRKKYKDWNGLLPLLKPAITAQIEYRDAALREDAFVPVWKNFQTWINKRCWEEEPGVIKRKPRTLLDT